MEKVQIKISENIYLKNPEESKLGRNILRYGIELMDQIGFEAFNFKKLATVMGSTEASIYRYFENKHKLLLYLISWYWNWIEYHFVFKSEFIEDDETKLRLAISLICKPISLDPTYEHIDEEALYRVVVSESVKVFLTKEVDKEEDQGCFEPYEKFCNRMAFLIQSLNPKYKYPNALTSAVIETAHNQQFFSKHMLNVTEVVNENERSLLEFISNIVFKVIK